MPRPQTKKELLFQSQQNFDKLIALIDSYSKEHQKKTFNGTSLNRNIRDIFAHLHHWHLMMKDWYTIGMKGKKPDMPCKGYTWKTMPDLNKHIRQLYLSDTLNVSRKKFESSHQDIQNIIASNSNADLFTKKKFAWTGSTSMGVYFVSNTSSHYAWAIKQIKIGLK